LNHLFKRGVDRNYIANSEDYRGIKGKLILSESLKRTTFPNGRAHCTYDDFSYDVLHNQVIKATLRRLMSYPSLDASLRDDLTILYHRFHDVSEITLTRRHFSQVVLHRNNTFYKFLLHVALVIYDNLLFDRSEGQWMFRDFFRDEDRMAKLFEKFILNFYKIQLKGQYHVGVEIIRWQAEAVGDSSLDYLPQMQTDISISSASRKIIIDAKFYREAMVKRFDSEKLRSSHSYQLYSYLSNVVPDNEGQKIEGVLMYPTVEKSFNHSYKLKGYPLSFRTLDLTEQWDSIETSLLAILQSPK
jgi:5-methylcytosine-specific restriction enzyme subunit McrC